MKIYFTNKQYLELMKLVYLGNWVANATRVDDKLDEYESMEDYIFSFAKDFGYERYVEHTSSDGKRYYPTSYFEDEADVDEVIDEYDNETFWQELTERLGERDFHRKYTDEEIKKMTQEERFIKRMECEEKYEQELDDNGLDNFELKNI